MSECRTMTWIAGGLFDTPHTRWRGRRQPGGAQRGVVLSSAAVDCAHVTCPQQWTHATAAAGVKAPSTALHNNPVPTLPSSSTAVQQPSSNPGGRLTSV